jgi:hypothetical protein
LATFKVVLNRIEHNGMRKQIFHQQIHGPDYIDYFGSPKKVDSRPFDENLEIHAKALGQAMQRQDETYHLQCDYQMHESLVIQQALIVCLGEDMTTV